MTNKINKRNKNCLHYTNFETIMFPCGTLYMIHNRMQKIKMSYPSSGLPKHDAEVPTTYP
jgi:hypothetical protein